MRWLVRLSRSLESFRYPPVSAAALGAKWLRPAVPVSAYAPFFFVENAPPDSKPTGEPPTPIRRPVPGGLRAPLASLPPPTPGSELRSDRPLPAARPKCPTRGQGRTWKLAKGGGQ